MTGFGGAADGLNPTKASRPATKFKIGWFTGGTAGACAAGVTAPVIAAAETEAEVMLELMVTLLALRVGLGLFAIAAASDHAGAGTMPAGPAAPLALTGFEPVKPVEPVAAAGRFRLVVALPAVGPVGTDVVPAVDEAGVLTGLPLAGDAPTVGPAEGIVVPAGVLDVPVAAELETAAPLWGRVIDGVLRKWLLAVRVPMPGRVPVVTGDPVGLDPLAARGATMPGRCLVGAPEPALLKLDPADAVSALDPLLLLLDGVEPPGWEESAWATADPPASAAPTPRVTAPAPSHVETSTRRCWAGRRAFVRSALALARLRVRCLLAIAVPFVTFFELKALGVQTSCRTVQTFLAWRLISDRNGDAIAALPTSARVTNYLYLQRSSTHYLFWLVLAKRRRDCRPYTTVSQVRQRQEVGRPWPRLVT